VSSECCHTSICDSKRGSEGLAGEKKMIFVLKLLGPILPVHSQWFHQKEYLGSWETSHWRDFSGLPRASPTKGRNPPYFQSDEILQLPICVFKNLMVTSNAPTHIDQRHSNDKDLLLDPGPWGKQPREWPLVWETVLELELRLTPKRALATFSS